jgi:hypothetical protein
LQSTPLSPTTDGNGALETGLDKKTEIGALTVHENVSVGSQIFLADLKISLRIGHLDPINEPSGQVARLRNLAYYPAPVGEIDEKLFRAAVEEFQCEHGLTVTGICEASTQAKLEEVYGC